jgi:uncharacterized protein
MSPRPKRIRKIINPPLIRGFKPVGLESKHLPDIPVFLLYEEYEAIRLCDYEMLNHHEASQIMEVSRPTLTRIYSKARQKIAEALVKGHQIILEGGKVYFDSDWFKCNSCTSFFNNPFKETPIKNCPLCGSYTINNYKEGFENDEYGQNRCCEVCICPDCGYEEEHQTGMHCKQIICPQCNTHLISKNKLK